MEKIFIGSLALALCLFSSCNVTRIYVVRHAEKSTDFKQDPPLTKDGQARAADLAKVLNGRKIAKIYSTETNRTRSTAMPLASQLNLPIQYYGNDTLPKFIFRLLDSAENALVVAHSNTVLKILAELELTPNKKEITDSEYDNLFIVSLRYKDDRVGYKIKLKETHYGKPSNKEGRRQQ